MLEGTSWWKRPLTQLLANPHYQDFRADIDLTVDPKSVQATERGRALYELMMRR
jgi:hypothetical protein